MPGACRLVSGQALAPAGRAFADLLGLVLLDFREVAPIRKLQDGHGNDFAKVDCIATVETDSHAAASGACDQRPSLRVVEHLAHPESGEPEAKRILSRIAQTARASVSQGVDSSQRSTPRIPSARKVREVSCPVMLQITAGVMGGSADIKICRRVPHGIAALAIRRVEEAEPKTADFVTGRLLPESLLQPGVELAHTHREINRGQTRPI